MPRKLKLSVVDLETDPVEVDGEYLPFVVGFFDGTDFTYFWDDPGFCGSCIIKWVAWMRQQRRSYLVYAHNGGKFDYMMMLEHLEKSLHIQNGRIVRAQLAHHELRDSFSIIPVALSEFKGKNEKQKFASRKEQTQYYIEKFNRKTRVANRLEILAYLEMDCRALYEGVEGFRREFGDKLTIGSTAMDKLREIHPFISSGKTYDEQFRPFYFGGRNECFRSGILKGDFKIYDVNSMYPFVMANFQHPISTDASINVKLTKRTTFALIEARNWGCLPIRTKTGLDFNVERGIFHACVHEINAGLETGTLEIIKVKHTIEHKETTTFAKFVENYYQKRLAAKEQSLNMLVTFYKLILNSAYGKFAQNPDNFKNYIITHNEIPDDICQPHCQPGCPYHWHLEHTFGKHFIWARPSNSRTYYNVATAASITSAARAVLLSGLANAIDPIYCDTDSIICQNLQAEIHPSKLGTWKQEATGTSVAIAGKKLYVVYDGNKPVKQANKGVVIEANDIIKLASGGTQQTTSIVPHFKFDGSHHYVSRRVKRTAAPDHTFGRAHKDR